MFFYWLNLIDSLNFTGGDQVNNFHFSSLEREV